MMATINEMSKLIKALQDAIAVFDVQATIADEDVELWNAIVRAGNNLAHAKSESTP